jgi:hypothetical protein
MGFFKNKQQNMKSTVDSLSESFNFETTNYLVELQTNHGPIRLTLWPDVAPGHCKNIMALAKSGFYDGLRAMGPGVQVTGSTLNSTSGPMRLAFSPWQGPKIPIQLEASFSSV